MDIREIAEKYFGTPEQTEKGIAKVYVDLGVLALREFGEELAKMCEKNFDPDKYDCSMECHDADAAAIRAAIGER